MQSLSNVKQASDRNIQQAVDALQSLIEPQAVQDATRFLFHSQFGIIKKNQDQIVQ
jgi:hypothetical protein